MRATSPILLGLVLAVLASSTVLAHPGSGIVVDRLGQVYFVDTGLGVWKIDRENRLLRHDGPSYHWMTIDRGGRFGGSRLPGGLARNVSVTDTAPTLILGGAFPLAVGADGALYYPAESDGAVRIMRLLPAAEPVPFATLPEAFETGPDGRRVRAPWIHGLAAGPDGFLYYTERSAVRRIAPSGSISSVADDVTVPECVHPKAIASTDAHVAPALRGLDVASDGTVYVAASACSALLSISPAGKVSVVLRSSDSWSPTGVALSDGEPHLYVLEYLYIPADTAETWTPRVRKATRDGKVSFITTVRRK